MRQVILHFDHEDGGWIAEVPSLPGCVSQGDSKQDAIANVQDAITAWVSAAKANGQQIPPDGHDCEIIEVPEKI